MNTQHKLLSAALAAALFATAPAFAQDSGTDTTETESTETSSVPKDRLVDRYSDAAGSDEAAAGLVTSLRDGDDLTFSETTTTTTTNADGTTTTTTSTSDVVVENPNGPMGWGEVDKALGIAEKLVDDGKFENLEAALAGSADITNPDGTVVEGSAGILQLRADGMGWGQIAKEYDFKLGSVVGNGKASRDADSDVDGDGDGEGTSTTTSTGASGKARGGSERSAKSERAAKVERVAKVDRPDRPDRVERPAKPERPERPQKPERSGRP